MPDLSDQGATNPSTPIAPSSPAAPKPSFLHQYKNHLLIALLVLAAVGGGFGLGRIGRDSGKQQIRLVVYGNVDLREVNLSFNDSERIAEVLVRAKRSRPSDIVQGEAQRRANAFQLQPPLRELADAELVAPCDAVVRSRLLEPGEMASPQRPVFNLGVMDPKCMRA